MDSLSYNNDSVDKYLVKQVNKTYFIFYFEIAGFIDLTIKTLSHLAILLLEQG